MPQKGATYDAGQSRLNDLNQLAEIAIRGLDQKEHTQEKSNPFISMIQRKTYSCQLKHDYCLFRIKFLQDSKTRSSPQTLTSAQLAFFRNIDPKFQPPSGFERRLRKWWTDRHKYLSDVELSNPTLARVLQSETKGHPRSESAAEQDTKADEVDITDDDEGYHGAGSIHHVTSQSTRMKTTSSVTFPLTLTH
jgi:hypothetical protein